MGLSKGPVAAWFDDVGKEPPAATVDGVSIGWAIQYVQRIEPASRGQLIPLQQYNRLPFFPDVSDIPKERKNPGFLCLCGSQINLYMPLQTAGGGPQEFFDWVEEQTTNHPFIVDSRAMDPTETTHTLPGGRVVPAGHITHHNVQYYAVGNFMGRIGYSPTVYCHSQLAVGSLSSIISTGGVLAEPYRGGSR